MSVKREGVLPSLGFNSLDDEHRKMCEKRFVTSMQGFKCWRISSGLTDVYKDGLDSRVPTFLVDREFSLARQPFEPLRHVAKMDAKRKRKNNETLI